MTDQTKALLPVTPEDQKRAEDWATMIGRMGGVFLDQSQRRGLASQFAAHRIEASGVLEEFVRHKRNCGAEHLDFDLPCDCGLDKILAALTPSALSGDAGEDALTKAREAAAAYWDGRGIENLAKAIRAGGCDDTMEVQVACLALNSTPRNNTGAGR